MFSLIILCDNKPIYAFKSIIFKLYFQNILKVTRFDERLLIVLDYSRNFIGWKHNDILETRPGYKYK